MIKAIKIRKASKVRTIIITLVLLLVVSFMGTSFTFLGGVAENKFTDNCYYDFKHYRVIPHLIILQAYYRHPITKQSPQFDSVETSTCLLGFLTRPSDRKERPAWQIVP